MKAIVLVGLACLIVGVTYALAFVTASFISRLREWKDEIDLEKRNELKLTLVVILAAGGFYLAIDIVLLACFFDVLKSVFSA